MLQASVPAPVYVPIPVWRTEVQIDRLMAEHGDHVAASTENHNGVPGPPGTANTTFARVVGECCSDSA